MSEKYTEAQALDPKTPGELLQLIALEEPALRAAVAKNPATYPALLEWLSDLHDPTVDAALAERVADVDATETAEKPRESAATTAIPPATASPVPADASSPGPPAATQALPPVAVGGGKGKRRLWIAIVAAVVVVLAGGGIAFATTRGGDVPKAGATESAKVASPSSSPSASESEASSPSPSPTPTQEPVSVVETGLVLPAGVEGLAHSGNLLLRTVDPDNDSTRGVSAYVWTDAAPDKVLAIPHRAPQSPDESRWSTYVGSEDQVPYVLRFHETRTPSEGLTPEKYHWFADRIDATTGEVTSSVPVDLSDGDYSSADVWAIGDRAFVQRYDSKFAIDLTTGQKLGIPTGEIRGATAQVVLVKSDEATLGLNPSTLKVSWTLPDDRVTKATGSYSINGPDLAGDAMVSYGGGVGALGSGAFEPAGPRQATDSYVDLASDGVLARFESEGKINGWYMLTPTALNFEHRFITTNLANDLDLEVYSVYDGVVFLKTTDQVLSVQLDGTVLNWSQWQWLPSFKIGEWTLVTSSPDYSADGERSVLVKNFTKEMLTDSLVSDPIEGPSGAPYDDFSSPSESPAESDY